MCKEMKVPCGMLCLMSRTDYDNLSEEKKNEIKPYYDAFQDSVMEARLISTEESTTVEIMLQNSYVEEAGMLLWSGIHDLISPGNIAYIEFHNFDQQGNTINIEKYIIDSIVMSVFKEGAIETEIGLANTNYQTIKITGCVSSEVAIDNRPQVTKEK